MSEQPQANAGCVQVPAPVEEQDDVEEVAPVERERPTLSASEILNLDDRKVVRVSVPGWPGDVYMRVVSGVQRDKVETMIGRATAKVNDIDGIRRGVMTLVVMSVCDAAGNLLFTEADIPALVKKSAPALDVLMHEAQRVSAILDDDIEELVKN